ncbi:MULTISPECIES: ABC transporter substrate-binding protein [Pseudoalteromonas]|jgi:polar amino acid transport system substrate-binding protein|uniref:substrate-binding periplasmic protein n=1 Tax=Pseudoalteromonas TaxID=53246 RepID=UPI000948B43F|nr:MULTISPECIES: transporter substrate-binding domain-containing protein [Pseudoalteromonas]MDX1728991.1 transporter substrate-binding domain-containing protein [Pseudoalteromonas tetraodonis]OLF74800.1 ABC transporter substrate-binding protein [Pseudoalteromonas haloplanktis]
MHVMLSAKLRYLIFTASFCLMALVSDYSNAIEAIQPKNEQPTHTTTLNISTGEWPPFLSESLPHQGVIAHLITDLFAQANIKVNFTFLPWPRAYHDTINDKYAATAVWMFEQQRTEDYFYSEPVLNERFVFFYHKKRPFDWQNLNDLKGLLLGGGLAYSYGEEFDKALQAGLFDMSRVSTTEQNFKRLAMGRIDAFAEEKSVGYHILAGQLPTIKNAIVHHPRPLLINKSFVMFPKNNEYSKQWLEIFNQQLLKFKQNGRYQTYFDALDNGAYQPTNSALAD